MKQIHYLLFGLLSILLLVLGCGESQTSNKGQTNFAGQAILGYSNLGCVEGPWVYLDASGTYNQFEAGCTTQFADMDSNGNLIPWCATQTVSYDGYDNVYITSQGEGTAWKECPIEDVKEGSEYVVPEGEGYGDSSEAVGDGTGKCGAGLTPCGPKLDCVAMSSDPSNCGSCGNWYFDQANYPGLKNAQCVEGKCVSAEMSASCGNGLTNCKGSCIDTKTDPSNCGSCGNWCFSQETYLGVKNAECVNSKCVLKECKKGFELKDGACLGKAKMYTGDGMYSVAKGDKIIASNGITVEVITFVSDIHDILFLNVYAGKDKLNLYPIPMPLANDDFFGYGKEVELLDYAIKITTYSKKSAKIKNVEIKLESLEKEQLTSCEQVYNLCVNKYKKTFVECFRYCAQKALSHEVLKQEGNVIVIADKKYSQYAAYVLSQAVHCNTLVKKVIAISPFNEKIYLRIFETQESKVYMMTPEGIHWPISVAENAEYYNSLKLENTCTDPLLIHELAHAFTHPQAVPNIIDEGFAVYIQHKTGILGKVGTVTNVVCNNYGFKITDEGVCEVSCAQNCLKEESKAGNSIFFGEKKVIQNIEFEVHKEGNSITLTQNGEVMTKTLPVEETILWFKSKIIGLIKFENAQGKYINILLYDEKTPNCVSSCAAKCPVIKEGFAPFADLKKGYGAGQLEAYSTSYCLFDELEKTYGKDLVNKYQKEIAYYRDNYYQEGFHFDGWLEKEIGKQATDTLRLKYGIEGMYGKNTKCLFDWWITNTGSCG